MISKLLLLEIPPQATPAPGDLNLSPEEVVKLVGQIQQLGLAGVLIIIVGVLLWILFHKDRREESRQKEFLAQIDTKHVQLIETLHKQHADDMAKHDEIIKAWQRDRETALVDRERHFALVVKVSTDCATAMQNMADAVREVRELVTHGIAAKQR